MTTRRDALVKAGLAKPGRGKFSTEANAWLDAQRAKGVTFDDDVSKTPEKLNTSSGRVKSADKTKAVKSVTEYPDYLYPSDYRFPEEEYVAVEKRDGKRVEHSMREVCSNCRVSLTNHPCENPVIHGNIVVKIERVVRS